jgi:hypothetical protein
MKRSILSALLRKEGEELLTNAAVLLQDAKALVKESGLAPSADLIKVLSQHKLSNKSDVCSSNVFRFCQFVLNQHQGSEFYISQFNSLINFLESCNIVTNCRSFVPGNASVLSNVKELNTYRQGRVDFVLISAEAVTADSIVLDRTEKSMLSFAHSNGIPVYVVSSILGIDVRSAYRADSCVSSSCFDGIISEYGMTSFDSFICSAKNSFSWLFF